MKSLLNDFIKHTIDCERYGNITKDDAVKLLQELYVDIVKKLKSSPYIINKKTYTRILSEIEVLLNEYKDNLKKLYEDSFENISSYQSMWMSDFMKELGKDIIIPTTILSSIKFSPVANTTDYQNIINNGILRIRETIETSLRTAYLTKEDMNEVSRRFEGREGKFTSSLEKDSAAINTTAFSTVNYLIYKANKQKVVYCAVLDSGTCFDCGLDNGKVFEIDKAPLLGKHYGCRCSLVPVEVLSDEEMPESYIDWIDNLSDKEQYDILGKTRYALYKSGMPIKHFVNDKGKLIPLKDIRK